MTEMRTNAYSSNLSSNTTKWSAKHNTVNGIIELSVKFDLEDAMSIIIDNWSEFDKQTRTAFARKVEALDMRDKFKEFKGGEVEEEEPFKW